MAVYGRATGFAARGAQLLSTAARELGPALLVGGAFTAASYAIEKIGQLFESDAQKVERYGVSWSGLSAALQQDTQTFLNTGQATEVFMTTTDGASQKLGRSGHGRAQPGISDRDGRRAGGYAPANAPAVRPTRSGLAWPHGRAITPLFDARCRSTARDRATVGTGSVTRRYSSRGLAREPGI